MRLSDLHEAFDAHAYLARIQADQMKRPGGEWDNTTIRAYWAANQIAPQPDIEEYLAQHGSEIDAYLEGHREEFVKAFMAIVRKGLEDFFAKYVRNGHIAVWRLMGLRGNPRKVLRSQRGLGTSWSHSTYEGRDSSHGQFGIHFDAQATDYVLIGSVTVDAVDWPFTIYRYVEFDDFEQEVMLLDGAEIVVHSVRRPDGTPVDIGPLAGQTYRA